MSPRRALNLAYAAVVENLTNEEREEFESTLHESVVDLALKAVIKKQREKEDRQRLAAEFGEVG